MQRWPREMINALKFTERMTRENKRCEEYNKKLDRLLRMYERGLITAAEVAKEAITTEY